MALSSHANGMKGNAFGICGNAARKWKLEYKFAEKGEMNAHLILYLLQHYISIIQICFLQISPHFPLRLRVVALIRNIKM